MLKISDAVKTIIMGNGMLHFGFYYRLLNLSQVARFIRPLVEGRTQKEVRDSAILMSLSRLQARVDEEEAPLLEDFTLDKITIQSGLCSLTTVKTEDTHRTFNKLFASIQEAKGFITITEGMSEITAIFDDAHFDNAVAMLNARPRHVSRQVAAVGVKFGERILTKPGIIYHILQQVALQNINIIEVASTATEFNIYLNEKDVELAFRSVYQRFSKRRRLELEQEFD